MTILAALLLTAIGWGIGELLGHWWVQRSRRPAPVRPTVHSCHDPKLRDIIDSQQRAFVRLKGEYARSVEWGVMTADEYGDSFYRVGNHF